MKRGKKNNRIFNRLKLAETSNDNAINDFLSDVRDAINQHNNPSITVYEEWKFSVDEISNSPECVEIFNKLTTIANEMYEIQSLLKKTENKYN